MPRSKRDDMKRSIAQAVNHQAAAILDINEVYKEFEEAAVKMEEAAKIAKDDTAGDQLSSHRQYADYLKGVMLALSANREAALVFALSAWNLDEEQLIRYA